MVALAVVLAGCSSSAGTVTPSPSSMNPLVTGDYSKVTCGEWLSWSVADQTASMRELNKRMGAFDQSTQFALESAIDVAKDCEVDPKVSFTQVVAAFASLDTADYK